MKDAVFPSAMELNVPIDFEEPGLVRANPAPGAVVTFHWRNDNWLGFTVDPEGGRPAEVVALLCEGDTELKSIITYVDNVRELREACGSFTARLTSERKPLFPPRQVSIARASIYLDGTGSAWIGASDDYQAWWVRLNDGKRNSLNGTELPSRGYAGWTLWRKVDEDETLIGTMSSHRGG